jgi:hypothetical protein
LLCEEQNGEAESHQKDVSEGLAKGREQRATRKMSQRAWRKGESSGGRGDKREKLTGSGISPSLPSGREVGGEGDGGDGRKRETGRESSPWVPSPLAPAAYTDDNEMTYFLF